MKYGDIIENHYAGENNPDRKVIFLRKDCYYIHFLRSDGTTGKFYTSDLKKDQFLKIVGHINLDVSGEIK